MKKSGDETNYFHISQHFSLHQLLHQNDNSTDIRRLRQEEFTLSQNENNVSIETT